MKQFIYLFIYLFISLSIFTSCKKKEKGCTKESALNYDSNAEIDDGSCIDVICGCMDRNAINYNSYANKECYGTPCSYYGNLMFWYDSNGTNATVTINGNSAYIQSYYSSLTPDCGASGCANFRLRPGTYNYTAQSTFNSWSGTITVESNGCSRVLLR